MLDKSVQEILYRIDNWINEGSGWILIHWILKNIINDLNYEGIKFPVSKKDYCKIERQNNVCINAFCYENGSTYPVSGSNQKFRDCMDLFLISDEISLIMCISKILTDLCVIKQKIKIKNIFANVIYSVLVVKKF